MPKLSGLFDSFDNLDSIDAASLAIWLKNPPALVQLENYLANKILYPQALPVTDIDMKIDLAILREALRLNGPKPETREGPLLGDNPFLNIVLRKVIIPQKFLNYVPDLMNLTWAFIDGLLLNRKKQNLFEDLWTVIVSDEIDEIVGSILLPQFEDYKDNMQLTIFSKDYKIPAGSLTIIPCDKDRCEIAYKFDKGMILGKSTNALEICGGTLGLVIDGRML